MQGSETDRNSVGASAGLLAGILLAAGKGTRMKSDRAKVLHPLDGVPMVKYPLRTLRMLGADPVVVVVGHQAREVQAVVEDVPGTVCVRQEPQLGTAHAVQQAAPLLREFPGPVLILSGDVPLVQAGDLARVLKAHREGGQGLTVVTTRMDDPRGYGRIVSGSDGEVRSIVEELDADEATRAIQEINAGIYVAAPDFLFSLVAHVSENKKKKEYYLTDIVSLAAERGTPARSFLLEDSGSVLGINTPEELNEAEIMLRERLETEENAGSGAVCV